jgi:translation initiation factor IF-3
VKPRTKHNNQSYRGPRVNTQIRATEVRLVNEARSLNEVMPMAKALQLTTDAGLDLIEITPKAKPPVCMAMLLSKWQYQQKQRAKENKSKQAPLKEIKFTPGIGQADIDHKVKQILDFLEHKHPVKITLFYRGRQMEHRELGFALFDDIFKQVGQQGKVTMKPKLQGRSLIAQIAPIAAA